MNDLHKKTTPLFRSNKIIVILLIGLLAVFVLSACGSSGDDTDDENDNDTVEVTDDATPTPEGETEEIDSQTVDETEEADDTDDTDATEEADDTDDAEATEEAFETGTFTAYWQPDAFVMLNTGEETLNLFGILITDGRRRYRIGSFMASSIIRELEPGDCVASFAFGQTLPEWVSELCPDLDGREQIATANFVWTVEQETFDLDIRGAISTCNTAEGQCEVSVPLGQEVGR